ncbi:MAG: TIGR03663 family protein [Vicinamibacterales bacterium]
MTTHPRPWQDTASCEWAAWALVVSVAATTRLWHLGARVMTHDESLHAYFSFRLFSEGVYRHEPVYHGPLLYYVDALVFSVLGVSDASARLAPAVAGILLVAALGLLRGFLGRRGALLAAALVTISPTLSFYSRHLRNDVYIAVFTLLWAYGAVRYLEQRRARWLSVVTASMALAVVTKEVSFITGAILGSFVVGTALVPVRDTEAARRRVAAVDLAVLMLLLVLPFASGAAFFAVRRDAAGPAAEAWVSGPGAWVVLLLFAAAGGGGAWRFGWRRWTFLFGGFWILQVLFFTTFFSNTRAGLASGIVGSLGYWLTQHAVARGSQPWFYYGLVGGLYEFLPMLLGAVAAAGALWRLTDPSWDPVHDGDQPSPAGGSTHATRRTWLALLIWWSVGSWLAYAWAGERMPWLLVHQVLPLCLLAGWGAGRLVAPLQRVPGTPAAWLMTGGAALVAVTVAVVVGPGPFDEHGMMATATTGRWLALVALQASLLAIAARAFPVVSGPDRRRLIGAGVMLLAVVVTVRASIRACFVTIDLPVEPLSYAQTSPDVPKVLADIASIDRHSGGAHRIAIALDDETLFPMRWYLRDYPNTVWWRDDPSRAASAPVVLAGLRNSAAWPLAGQGYARHRAILLWWPLQRYNALTLRDLRSMLVSPAQRQYLLRIFIDREFDVDPRTWPGNREFDIYVRRDVAVSDGGLDGLGGRGRAPLQDVTR